MTRALVCRNARSARFLPLLAALLLWLALPVTATHAQVVVQSNNRNTAIAVSGDAVGDGIGSARTVIRSRRGGAISVTNSGTAANTSGDVTALGQQGDNIVTVTIDDGN